MEGMNVRGFNILCAAYKLLHKEDAVMQLLRKMVGSANIFSSGESHEQ
jgi:hypothetical protein